MLNRVTFKDNKIRRAIGKEVIESYVYEMMGILFEFVGFYNNNHQVAGF